MRIAGLSGALALLFITQFACLPDRIAEGRVRLERPDETRQITGKFRFLTEDRPEFANLSYDDGAWPFIEVPAQWFNVGIRHDRVAWYRLRFEICDECYDDLAAIIPYTLGAHELYVNGRLIGGMGKIGPTHEESAFSTRINLYQIPADLLEKDNVLAVRVKPFTAIGGIALPDFYLGAKLATEDQFSRYLIWNSLLAGISLIIGIYYLLLFGARRSDRSYLYFSLIAFCSFLYTLSSKTLDFWILDSYLLHESLIHLPMAVIPLFLIRFFQAYFQIPLGPFAWFFMYSGPIFGLIFLAGNIRLEVYEFHVLYLFPLQIFLILPFFVFMLYHNVRCVLEKKFGARTIFFGFLCYILAVVNDALSNQLIWNNQRLVEEGFILLTCSMAVALGMRLSHSLNRTDELNRHLDQKVLERTSELRTALDSVHEARAEVEKLNEFNLKINETTDLNKILEHVFQYMQDNFGLDGTMLHLADFRAGEYRFFKVTARDFHTREEMEFAKRIVFPMDERGGMVWEIIQKKRSLYLPRFPVVVNPDDPIVRLKSYIGFESGMIVPLVVQDEAIGVMFFTNYTAKMRLSRAQTASIKRFSEQIAGAVYGSSLLNQVKTEREKSDQLLLNILPSRVADELKEHGRVQPLNYDIVTVLFTDFVGFTKIAETLPPEKLIGELDGCFTQFDEVTFRHGLEKLKTIGDAYMCAGGLPARNWTNPVDACLAALEFLAFMQQMKEIKENLGLPCWSLRIGLHSGPVTAGVVGKNKFAYDIWGDTVNTASRMESSGAPNRINISGPTFRLVEEFFSCEYRGKVEAKGKGKIDMYFLNSIRSELADPQNPLRPGANFQERYAELKGREKKSADLAEGGS